MDNKPLPNSAAPNGLLRSARLGSLFGALGMRVCRNLLVLADLSSPDSLPALSYLCWTGKFKMVAVVRAQRDAVQSERLARLRRLMRKHKHVVIADDPATQASIILDDSARNDAVDFILEKSRRHSRRRRLPVLLLKTVSDLALSMQKDPTLAERIEVLACGFSEWPKGGLSRAADVTAWQLLLDADVPLTVAASDAGSLNLGLNKPELRTQFGSDLSGLLAAAYLSVGGQTVAYRRPVLNNDGTFLHGNGSEPLPCQTCASEPRVLWIKTVHTGNFLGQLQRALAAADKQ